MKCAVPDGYNLFIFSSETTTHGLGLLIIYIFQLIPPGTISIDNNYYLLIGLTVNNT